MQTEMLFRFQLRHKCVMQQLGCIDKKLVPLQACTVQQSDRKRDAFARAFPDQAANTHAGPDQALVSTQQC